MNNNKQLAMEIVAGMAVIKATVDLSQQEAEYQVRLQKRLDAAHERRDLALAAMRRQD